MNKISASQLKSVPGLQPLRRDLLGSALRFYEDFVKERGDDPTLKAGLANTYNLIAVLHDMRNRLAESVRAHEQAFILRRALVAAHPGDPSFQNALASSLNNLGVLLDKTSPEEHEKLAMFRRSVEHGRLACAAAPGVDHYGRFLTAALRNVGSSEVAIDHPDAAMQSSASTPRPRRRRTEIRKSKP